MQSIHCSKLSKRATDNNRPSIQDAVMLHDSEMYAKTEIRDGNKEISRSPGKSWMMMLQ